jgi:hypothetical protein
VFADPVFADRRTRPRGVSAVPSIRRISEFFPATTDHGRGLLSAAHNMVTICPSMPKDE